LTAAATPPKAFKIIDAGIHQTEDGPLVEKGATFVPGEVIFFSCRLDGYHLSEGHKVAIQYEFSAVDPAGVPVIEPAGKGRHRAFAGGQGVEAQDPANRARAASG
jgi:hypothetical protein